MSRLGEKPTSVPGATMTWGNLASWWRRDERALEHRVLDCFSHRGNELSRLEL